MLTPAASATIQIATLRRKRDLALAEYRHAWDYRTAKRPGEYAHIRRRAVEAQAAIVIYEAIADRDLFVVDGPTFWTQVERYARTQDAQRAVAFPGD